MFYDLPRMLGRTFHIVEQDDGGDQLIFGAQAKQVVAARYRTLQP
jgi:hypothetical protein